jgi:outer membrane protein, heavy metal efflux system
LRRRVLHLAVLLLPVVLATPGCRTSGERERIEHLTPHPPPPYPVVTIDYASPALPEGAPPPVRRAHLDARLDATFPSVAVPEELARDEPTPDERTREVSARDEPARDEPARDEPARHGRGAPELAGMSGEVDSDSEEGARDGLSLDVLSQWAEMHNPTLRQAALAIQAARGRRYQAGLYPNPTLGYVGSEIGNEGQAGQQGGFVGQTIVTGHKLSVNRAVATREVEQSLWTYEARQLRVFNDVALRHAEALGAERIMVLTEELERVATEGVEVSRRLFESGQVGRADVLQAEIQRNQIRILRQTAESNAEAARRRLAHIVGLSELPDQPLVGELEGPATPFDFDQVWNQLLTASPQVMVARAAAERARMQQQVERLRPVPNLELYGSVQRDNVTDDVIYGAQFGMAIPLFDGNQGNMAAAQAEYARARAELERLTLSLRDELAEVWQRYQIARAEVERFREEIIPSAEENLRLTEEGYRLGELDFLRVLTARQTYFQTNVDYRRSLIDLRQAEILISGLLLTGGLGGPEI